LSFLFDHCMGPFLHEDPVFATPAIVIRILSKPSQNMQIGAPLERVVCP
jgi:hypothetical protein